MTELNAILKIADLHAERIKSALRHIEHLFPIIAHEYPDTPLSYGKVFKPNI